MQRHCHQCQNRHPGCHSHCELYAADRADDEKRLAAAHSMAYIDTMPQTASAWRKTFAPRKYGGKQ